MSVSSKKHEYRIFLPHFKEKKLGGGDWSNQSINQKNQNDQG